MLTKAAKRLNKLRRGNIEHSYQQELPWSVPHDFTVAVTTFVLCTMKDTQPVIEEIRRHLRVGAKLILFEFGRSSDSLLYKVEKAINPLTKMLFGVDFDRKPTIELIGPEWKLVDINWVFGGMIYQAMIERTE
ncbi:MAG: class I SAM-dependent methyltransferase [Methanobacteriota archaeon]|nr:MAG: class I SAM-dependent methyltransferase [Euryarchaeota archaeon]